MRGAILIAVVVTGLGYVLGRAQNATDLRP